LKRLFDAAGIAIDRPTATYCQSGGRAAVMAYGLELMGAKDVRNYYRSWSEWGNADDTPVVKPVTKKKQ
jgi:thiosulfate/3-mercaptopyruvate sulfurtransferase